MGIGYNIFTKKEISPQRAEPSKLEIKVQNSDKGNKSSAILTYEGRNYLLIPDEHGKLTIQKYVSK